jgi:hypothetical protein
MTLQILVRWLRKQNRGTLIFFGQLAYTSHGVLSSGIHISHMVWWEAEPCFPDPVVPPTSLGKKKLKVTVELTPHAYGPGALLGVCARPAPTPYKPLAGRLALH